MKKLLCICVALILALGSFCALAEETLQAQLDAANAKIEELQAQVDAYYPFYFAQIVARFGDNVIWLSDVQAQYEMMKSQYESYGINLAQYGLEGAVKQGVVESAVEDAVLLAKAAELGLDQPDAETLAAIEADADAMLDAYVHYYLDNAHPGEEVTDEMHAEAENYLTLNGLTRESLIEDSLHSAQRNAVNEYVTGELTFSEDELNAYYQDKIASNKEAYQNERSFTNDLTSGATIAWMPEGYRAVKHVLIKFDDAQAQRYSELQGRIDSLNAEKEAAESPAEPAEGEEQVAPRAISEIDAELAACATELEALYSELQPTADAVVKAFNEGADFDALIEQYNADPGMMNEPTATSGYAVCANSTVYDPAFAEGAMSIEELGQISAPVYGMYGIHVIWYMSDVPAGEVALEDIREPLMEEGLKVKKQETYDAQLAKWIEEANVEYFMEHFGA